MKKIYVFGSLIMDHTTRCDVLPRDGESTFGDSFEISYGGKGINQAMMIKRLGADVTMIGALGKDTNGEQFKKLLLEKEFDISTLFFKDNVSTGVSNIIIDKSGQNRIIVVPGANNYLTSEDILSIQDKIEEDSYFLLQNEIPVDTIETIIDLGVRKHATIILNPAPFKKLKKETLDKVDYITPNETEASDMFGLESYDEKEILSRFDELKTKCLIMTLGDKGSLLYDHKNVIKNDPFKVKVIDTVGAGDAFNGGFTYALSEGKNVREALRIANACGALTIEKKGALVSQPSKEEVLEFLRKN